LYLPNGNPYPGPKFDFKQRWFARLLAYSAELIELEVPVVLTGNYNVSPTELDVYKPERWTDDALYRIEIRDAFKKLMAQGWTDSARAAFRRAYTHSGAMFGMLLGGAGLRLDHFLISPALKPRLLNSGVGKTVRGWGHTSDHAPVWIELDE
jgi:exodeoxyribonuclease III